MKRIGYTDEMLTPQESSWMSYRAALTSYREQPWLSRIPWVTWLVTILTCLIWVFTSQQTAVALGFHGIAGWLAFVGRDAINIAAHDNDVLSQVLLTYGAKELSANKMISILEV